MCLSTVLCVRLRGSGGLCRGFDGWGSLDQGELGGECTNCTVHDREIVHEVAIVGLLYVKLMYYQQRYVS